MVAGISGAGLSPNVLRLLGMGGSDGNSRASGTIASLASGVRLGDSSVDVAAMSAANSLRSEISSLKGAQQNISQQSSLLQVANDGLEQIFSGLERMQALATQANSGALDENARRGIEEEFAAIKEEINRIAEKTSFNNINLLDGSYNDDELDSEFSIADMRMSAILPDDLDLSSAEGAAKALDAVSDALNKVSESRASVGSYMQRMDVTSAAIDSAIENQEAARAALEDTDFLSASTELSQEMLKNNSTIAMVAQGNKLSDNMMKLISGS